MAPKPNPPPKEDTWAFQPIGSPFPPSPVKCMGEQNMYVALWYKHGKPIHGRSWNNGGVVECSFPYKEAELTTKAQLEGQIQVLQYVGDHNNQGFWYEWIKYKDRIEKIDDKHQLFRCGDSFPIFWKRKEGNLLGYVDNKTEEAWFSFNGKVIKQVGPQLNDMYIITRNCIGGPPHCECDNCPKPPPPPPIPPPGPPPPRVMHDEWIDIREGDPFPTRKLVQALDKTLDTLPGVNPDQYVALWYMQGEPVMGRVWNEGGKVAANFSWFNNEYCKGVGSIQLLVRLGPHVVGYEYGWIPFPEAATFEEGKTWKPVHVNNHKGDISVGVVNLAGGKQILAKVDVRNESYGYGYQGKEIAARGPACASSVTVLCRKALPGYKLDG
ncbi:hypothetical protein GCK72_013308 [Caenorhabditis remanei]|uniref:Uncharacterized protein n=1 Tax=Caenorhabditis remanei TaxID=31234 RepID=A0A6A5GQE7_CAERE|nr:hypothetical protein GCK72_013308 [Caenorhabditis remanei]KAF1756854.1 hypothetical protein GCK72_013308 [Caenorhabditis remanei]